MRTFKLLILLVAFLQGKAAYSCPNNLPESLKCEKINTINGVDVKSSDANKSIVYFFRLDCPLCSTLHKKISAWKKDSTLGKNFSVVHAHWPVDFNEIKFSNTTQQKFYTSFYYVADIEDEKTLESVFNYATSQEGRSRPDINVLAKIVNKDVGYFLSREKSFSGNQENSTKVKVADPIEDKYRRGKNITQKYNIQLASVFVVNGKYLLSISIKDEKEFDDIQKSLIHLMEYDSDPDASMLNYFSDWDSSENQNFRKVCDEEMSHHQNNQFKTFDANSDRYKSCISLGSPKTLMTMVKFYCSYTQHLIYNEQPRLLDIIENYNLCLTLGKHGRKMLSYSNSAKSEDESEKFYSEFDSAIKELERLVGLAYAARKAVEPSSDFENSIKRENAERAKICEVFVSKMRVVDQRKLLEFIKVPGYYSDGFFSCARIGVHVFDEISGIK